MPTYRQFEANVANFFVHSALFRIDGEKPHDLDAANARPVSELNKGTIAMSLQRRTRLAPLILQRHGRDSLRYLC